MLKSINDAYNKLGSKQRTAVRVAPKFYSEDIFQPAFRHFAGEPGDAQRQRSQLGLQSDLTPHDRSTPEDRGRTSRIENEGREAR